jgi:D-beta-D-heptose 7-phosphate kinase / D-beta-D-heptose 1-phosphate adenosyltransferase
MLKFLQKSVVEKIINEKFSELKIAVIGDLMLDQYLWGRVSRISPEAPVPVFNIERKTFSLGGAGNVAHNLVAMGCQTRLLGIVGSDIEAKILKDSMLHLDIDTCDLIEDESRPTTTKTRVVSSSQQLIRLDNESSEIISQEIEQIFLQRSISQLDDVNLVILSDYNKGALTNNFLKTFLQIAREKNISVLVDPKRNDYDVYTGATAITPNRAESELALKRPLISDKDFEIAGQELQQNYSLEAVLMTRSEKGMTLSWNGDTYHFPTYARQVFDISGAGDSVIALLGASLAAGVSWPEAVELSNLGAGVAIQKIGTAPVYKEELLQVLEQEGISTANSKILRLSDLTRQLASWRAKGKKIVFTNGCFDLLHVGHVIFLEKARSLGDILIIGLNTDNSVKSLKGLTRPLVAEADRSRVLASLNSVSAITLFDQVTPIELIKAIKPDVLVKGADYREEEVAGASFVRSYEGQVILIPLVDNRSTSKIVDKIINTA